MTEEQAERLLTLLSRIADAVEAAAEVPDSPGMRRKYDVAARSREAYWQLRPT